MFRKWIAKYNFQYFYSTEKNLIPYLSEGKNLKVIHLWTTEALSETDFEQLLTLTKIHSLEIYFDFSVR